MTIKDKITKNEILLDAYSNLDSTLNRLKLYFNINSHSNFIECLNKIKKDVQTLIDELE